MANNVEKNNIPHANLYYERHGWLYDRSIADKGADLLLQAKSTEEKFRVGIYPDIAIEILQCMKDIGILLPKALGWFHTTTSERLIYYMGCTEDGSKSPDGFYDFDFVSLKPWIYEYLKRTPFPRFMISPKGYGISLNLLIKTADIPGNLYVFRSYNQDSLFQDFIR